MFEGKRVGVVIPAFNEAEAIGHVISDIPDWADDIVVGDNASTDGTADVAIAAGARVVREAEQGYGAACLAALGELKNVDVVVFVDGDRSDYPQDMAALVAPIASGEWDMVIASRTLGEVAKGALTPQQRFGNWLATRLIWLIWGAYYTDLGPFRAIQSDALRRLQMADRTYGWTVEMQIKAVEHHLSVHEVPARYRRRIGVSKISGTVIGTVLAGYKILSIIAREASNKFWRKAPHELNH
ncbi:MAG: glycosyltransferase family 2 protein [Hyphomicrobiaceae bacterium]